MAAWQSVAIALAIGLLIGATRRGDGTPDRAAEARNTLGAYGPAGFQLFALAALGGVAAGLVGPIVLGAAVLAAAAICAATLVAGGWRPVSTSEHDARPEQLPAERLDPISAVALALTVLLGGLVVTHPALAVGAGVVAALVMLVRSGLPHLLRDRMAELELVRALRFLVIAFLALPLAPSASVGPLGAVDPRRVWTFVVAVTGLGWLGYVLVRLAGPSARPDRAPARGPDWELPLAGLAGGFVSGAATTGAMARTGRDPDRFRPAMAGALLATVATLVLVVLVTAVADTDVAGQLVPAAALTSVALIAEALWLVLVRPGKPGGAVLPSAADEVEEPEAGDGPANGIDGWVVPTGRAPTRESSAAVIEGGATVTAIDFGAPPAPAAASIRSTETDPTEDLPRPRRGLSTAIAGRRPCDLVPALLLTVMLVVFVCLAALAQHGLGAGAALLTISLAGLADTHAGALTAAELAHQGRLATGTACLAIAAALAAGTIVRLIVAEVAGGRRASTTLAALYAGPIVAFTAGLILTVGLS